MNQRGGAQPLLKKILIFLRTLFLFISPLLIGGIILKSPDLGPDPLRGNWVGLLCWILTSALLLHTSVTVLFAQYEEPGALRLGLFYWIATVFLGQKQVQLVLKNSQVKTVKPSGPMAETFSRFGAPGIVIIDNGVAAVFERSGRFTRVHGPGVAFTLQFEKIAHVVDLRPKLCQGNIEGIQTRDGWTFAIKPIFATYQIATGFDRNDGKYRFNDNDIFNLVYGGGHLYSKSREIDPESRVIGMLEYFVRDITGGRTILQISRAETRNSLGRQDLIEALKRLVAPALLQYGIRLQEVDLGRIVLPPEITHRRAIHQVGRGLSDAIKAIQDSMTELQSVAPHVAVHMAGTMERLAQSAVTLAAAFDKTPALPGPQEEDE